MVDTCPCIFVKTQNAQHKRAKPHANYKLWVVIMSQCSFISCNKCTSLMQATDIGEMVCGWRQEV